MDQEKIFGNYEQLLPGTVQILVKERGLDRQGTLEDMVGELYRLDEAIDTNRKDYETWDLVRLLDLAVERGIDVRRVPGRGRDFLEILKVLREYEEGTFQGPFIKEGGQEKYNYARERYNWLTQKKEETPHRVTALVTPRRKKTSPPRTTGVTEEPKTPVLTPKRRNISPPKAPKKEGVRRPLQERPPAKRLTFEEPMTTQKKTGKEEIQVTQPNRITFIGEELEIPTEEEVYELTVDKLQRFLAQTGVTQSGLRRKADYIKRVLEIRDLILRTVRNGSITKEDWQQALPQHLQRQDFFTLIKTPRTRKEAEMMTMSQLRTWLDRNHVVRIGVNTKKDLVDLVVKHLGLTEEPVNVHTPTLVFQGAREVVEQEPEVITDPEQAIMTALTFRPKPRKYKGYVFRSTFTVDELVYHIQNAVYYIDGHHDPTYTPIEYIMRSPDPFTLADQVIAKMDLTEYMPPTSQFRQKIDFLSKFYSFREVNHVYVTTRPLLKLGLKQLLEKYPILNDLNSNEIAITLWAGRAFLPYYTFVPEAFAEVDNYTPSEIIKIVKYLYDPRDDKPGPDKSISLFSPYETFLMRPLHPLIPFIVEWKDQSDPSEIAYSLGMIFPPSVDVRQIRIKYFLENIRYYANIYTRPDPVDPPPILEDLPYRRYARELRKIVNQYTDYELLDAYEISFVEWDSRPDFNEKIIEEALGEPRWSFRRKKCNNLNRINIITADPISVTDEDDPILSYGTLNKYRCYQVSELMESFKEDEKNGFVFGVPDWVNPNLDPNVLAAYNYPLPNFREFPIASIRQLKRLLENVGGNAYNELKAKIDAGLTAKNNIKILVDRLREEYRQFSPQKQTFAQDYIFFLFLLSMYMRFWEGPGHDFPMKWLEGGTNRCLPDARDKNVVMMFNIRTALLEKISLESKESGEEQELVFFKGKFELIKVTPIEKWIFELPRVRYDFQSGAVSIGQESIDYIVTEAQDGNFCLAEASDHLLMTSYFYIRNILNMSLDDFNNHIRFILDTPDQPPFQPELTTETHHIDPFHTLREEES
jgi:hypothetical protein